MKIIFNSFIFLFLAFLVSTNKKLLRAISIAALVSPIVVLPVYRNYTEGVFISGGRLAGFLQTPIIFGMYIAVIYLIGLGMFFAVRNKWMKALIAAWLVVIANFILWAASRASWLALALTLAIWFCVFMWRKDFSGAGRLAAAVGITFLIGHALLPSSDYLAIQQWVDRRVVTAITNPLKDQSRTREWSSATGISLHNLLGIGLTPAAVPDNTLLEIEVIGGVGAFLAACLFAGKILFEMAFAFKKLQRRSDPLSLAWLLGGLAIFISIFFTDGFFLRHVWAVFGIALGAAWEVGGS